MKIAKVDSLRISHITVGLLCIGFLTSCMINLQKKKNIRVLTTDYCIQVFQPGPDPTYRDSATLLTTIAKMDKTFTSRELKLANSIGILGQVEYLMNLRKTKSPDNELQLVKLGFQIVNGIDYAHNVINGIVAEINCECERTLRIVGYMDDISRKKVNKLTIGAIFAGTVSGIAPLIVKQQSSQNAMVITGSALSATLGVLALTDNRKVVQFSYDKNFLSDIWYNPERSTVYPEFIWLLLRDRKYNNHISIATGLKRRWNSLEFDQNIDESLEKLLFVRGGLFKEDALNTRAVLLKQLVAEIELLNIELVNLYRKLDISGNVTFQRKN